MNVAADPARGVKIFTMPWVFAGFALLILAVVIDMRRRRPKPEKPAPTISVDLDRR